VLTTPYLEALPDNYVLYTSLAVGTGDTVRFAAATSDLTYLGLDPSGRFTPPEGLPDRDFLSRPTDGGSSAPIRRLGVPHLATQSRAGKLTVHLAYGPDVRFQAGRYGVGVDGGWTFADVPERPSGVAVDASGDALVLQKQAVLRHRGSTVDSIPLPAELVTNSSRKSITTDPSGAWYVAASDASGIHVGRRRASGEWSVELVALEPVWTTPIRILWGAGTVHVAHSNRYYRRVGTEWEASEVTTDPQASFDMALDACGAPHFVVSNGGGGPISLAWEIRYARWTRSGFRWLVLAPAATTPSGTSIAVTAGHAYVAYGGYSAARVDAIPLE
jgi:hypothetical protein